MSKESEGSDKMIKSVVFSRSTQTIRAFDDTGEELGAWECRDEFEDGFNEYGQPRESLPDGVYPDIEANVYAPGEQEPAFGTFYISTGDERGRDIHGGGSSLEDPYVPYQGWRMTYGCLRMQNADGEELAEMIMEAARHDICVTLHVGD